MILEQQELKELSELQRLIEAGLERGSLSTGEIVEVLAELEIEVDQIEELYRELEAQGRKAPKLILVTHEHANLNAALGCAAVSGIPWPLFVRIARSQPAASSP